MIRTRSTTTAALFLLCTACGGGEPRSAAKSDTTSSAPPASRADDQHDPAASADTTLKVTFTGMGPLRVGMTPEQARRSLGHFSSKGPIAGEISGDEALLCQHATSMRLPAGVRVMLEGGRVVRVEVDSATASTAEGARVGDTEDRIQQLYPGRVTVEPHKYTDGHYLVVRPAEPSDTMHLMIFETNGRVVERFRAGQRPQVEYVEGCS